MTTMYRLAILSIAGFLSIGGNAFGQLDDIVTPAGEHDHFLGFVRFLGTGTKNFPDVPGIKNRFMVEWSSANETVRKETVAPAFGSEGIHVYALKSKPAIYWYQTCPTPETSCYCSNGGYYGTFLIGSKSAAAQDFSFEVPTSRLDVNDMRIVRQDGSEYYAKGHYELTVEVNMGGYVRTCTLLSGAATKTGLDVGRGFKYHIVTQAVSEEGSTLQSSLDVDLR